MKNFWMSIKFSLGTTALLTLIAYFTTSIPMLQRLLPWNELLILLLALISFHGANIMASYFRAYGSEPISKINFYCTTLLILLLGDLLNRGLFLAALCLLLANSGVLLAISIYLAKHK